MSKSMSAISKLRLGILVPCPGAIQLSFPSSPAVSKVSIIILISQSTNSQTFRAFLDYYSSVVSVVVPL